jgi:hypothetical protein
MILSIALAICHSTIATLGPSPEMKLFSTIMSSTVSVSHSEKEVSIHSALQFSANYKTCNFHSNAEWEEYPKHSTSSLQFVLTNADVEICKLACLQTTDFNCRSFAMLRGENACYLKSTAV